VRHRQSGDEGGGEPEGEPTLPPPGLNSLLQEWVPIRGRYVIIGGVVEGIGQIKPVKILEEGTLPKIPGRDSTEYLMRRENPTWDSGTENPGSIFRPGLPRRRPVPPIPPR
jgi:hypothetical protein